MEVLTSPCGSHRIGISYVAGELRVLLPGEGPTPPYSISGDWRSAAGGRIVEISNLSGVPGHQPMRFGHMVLIIKWAMRRKFLWMLAYRLDGRKIPCANKQEDGFYKDWLCIDLCDPEVQKGVAGTEIVVPAGTLEPPPLTPFV